MRAAAAFVLCVVLRMAAFAQDTSKVDIFRMASSGRVHLIELDSINIDTVAGKEHTLLYHAAFNCDTAGVKLLLSKGASIEHRGQFGIPPLHGSVFHCDTNMTKLLHGAGANIHSVDYRFENVLHHCVGLGGKAHDAHARYFLRHGVSLEARNRDGQTPLDLALYWKNPTMAILYHKAGGPFTQGKHPRYEKLLQKKRYRRLKRVMENEADDNHNRLITVGLAYGYGGRHILDGFVGYGNHVQGADYLYRYHAINAGAELSRSKDESFSGFKLGYNFDQGLLSARAWLVNYTDFKRSNYTVNLEGGFNLIFLTLTYARIIPVSSPMEYPERNRVTLGVRWPVKEF